MNIEIIFAGNEMVISPVTLIIQLQREKDTKKTLTSKFKFILYPRAYASGLSDFNLRRVIEHHRNQIIDFVMDSIWTSYVGVPTRYQVRLNHALA